MNPAVFAGVANAFAFAYGVNPDVPALQVDLAGGPIAAGVATVTLAYGKVALADGTVIDPLATNAPVIIGEGANQETVTPTAVSNPTPDVYQSASFTATFTKAHGTGEKVSSGSFGLAEAVNSQFAKGGGAVMVDRDFKQAGGVAGTITGTAGYGTVPVVQNMGAASGAAFSYKSTGTAGAPADYTVTTVSWY